MAYPLNEILLLCLTAVVAGAESITAIALFGAKRLDLPGRFAAFENGTPAHFSIPQSMDICRTVGLSNIANRFRSTFQTDVDASTLEAVEARNAIVGAHAVPTPEQFG